MKRSLLILPLLGLLATGCASNDPTLDDGKNPGSEQDIVNGQFLSVSISSVGSGTRAGEQYKDGTDDENSVSSVRFYFFTATGEPASVKYNAPAVEGQDGTYQSYYDWEPDAEQNTSTDSNIEKIISATIIINSESKDKVPYSVIAVLNPSEEYKNESGDQNLSVSELTSIIKDYNTEALTKKNHFVISNSVYLDEYGVEQIAVPVSGHIFTSESLAKENPVEIYVERVVARLDLSVSMTPLEGKTNIFDTGVKYEIVNTAKEEISYDDNIYVKFLGWNVTAATASSNLIKSIDATWADDLFGVSNEPWNNPGKSRSFWAINPNGVAYNYGNFGQALPSESNPNNFAYTNSGNIANAKTNFGTIAAPSSVYLQENAAEFDKDGFCNAYNNTKVIIAAQLVQKDGTTPITLAEWGFNYYTEAGLRTLLAQELNIYKITKTTDAGDNTEKTIYTKIDASDLEFVTAGSLDSSIKSAEKTGRYYVHAQLKKQEGVKWALSNAEGTAESSYDEANDLVKMIPQAKIWNGGYTYYFFDIRHLGAAEKPGYNGVVRNHIYSANISALTGLGTPIYDPNEVIYPEKPTNDNSLIAAEIKVLSWRIVPMDIKLQW